MSDPVQFLPTKWYDNCLFTGILHKCILSKTFQLFCMKSVILLLLFIVCKIKYGRGSIAILLK